jgi:glycosyltransferase involved in cell wall biosynthesis
MRVLELYGGGSGGGAARYLDDLLPALSHLGQEVHFVSLGRDDLQPAGAKSHRATTCSQLAQIVAQIRPHVLHTHGVRANFRGRICGRLLGVPVVTTVHSFLAQDYRTPERAALALHVDGATLHWSDRLIAISDALRTDLVLRGALPASVRVVPNGADPPHPDPDRLRALLPPGDGPLLCVAARLHPTKGVDVALSALRHLPKARLAILGDGPERASLEKLAGELGVLERAHFLGYRTDFAAIVAGADLFLVPSRAEGFGLAALEAMGQGVPVVASRVGGLPEVVGDAGAFAAAGDPAALAAAVVAALQEREALAQRARERAALFTVQRMAEATLGVLHEATEVCR